MVGAAMSVSMWNTLRTTRTRANRGETDAEREAANHSSRYQASPPGHVTLTLTLVTHFCSISFLSSHVLQSWRSAESGAECDRHR